MEHILIVEDRSAYIREIKSLLKKHEITATIDECDTGEAALACIIEKTPTLAIVDIGIFTKNPTQETYERGGDACDGGGQNLVKNIRLMQHTFPIIIFTIESKLLLLDFLNKWKCDYQGKINCTDPGEQLLAKIKKIISKNELT